ncbi:MAG: hypothetical protein J7L38_05055 [Thermoproteales archaeon]|nr:hypothetical protein [Thermoproteales archaeon]
MGVRLKVNFRKFKLSVKKRGAVETVRFLLSKGKHAERVDVVFPADEEKLFKQILNELGLKPVYVLSLTAGFYVDISGELHEVYDLVSANFGEDVADDMLLYKHLFFMDVSELKEIATGKIIPWVVEDRVLKFILKGLDIYQVSAYIQPVQIENLHFFLNREYLFMSKPIRLKSGSLYDFIKNSKILEYISSLAPKNANIIYEVKASLLEAPVNQPYF